MSDISLLPEDMREKEELKTGSAAPPKSGQAGLKMHIPEAEPEEDIEIIEVDEGDLASVLADEPLMTRLTYKLSSAIDGIRGRLFEKKEAIPTPKIPPQFFKPPKPGLVSAPAPGGVSIRPVVPGVSAADAAKGRSGFASARQGARAGGLSAKGSVSLKEGAGRARITPQQGVPRRVRVIRRVRKPVRVSLISSKELAALTVDVSKRKWTVSFAAFAFIAVLVAGRIFMERQIADAQLRLAGAQADLQATKNESQRRLAAWSAFEDLQDRLELLDGALKRHIVISRFFDFLETRTIPEVTYSAATWSADGGLTLDASADSFESAARQLVSFKESDIVKSAESSSFSLSGGSEGAPSRVTFQILLSIDSRAFRGAGLSPVASSSSSRPLGS
jgi:hypothetical protein